MQSEEENVDEHHRYRYKDPAASNSVANNDPPSIWFSKRFCVSVLLFVGYLMHGIVCQVTGLTYIAMTTEMNLINKINNITVKEPSPQFEWKLKMDGMILNMFWIGFVFSFLGGFLAQKCGGARVLGASMLLSGVFVSLNAFVVQTHFFVYYAIQGSVGVLQGFFLVSSTEVFACWLPKKERFIIMSCIISGMHIGAGIMLPVCSLLAQHWKWYFYATGILCIVWSSIWLIVVRNEPLNDKEITERECMYILRESGSSMNKRSIQQYNNISVSLSCWILFLCKFALGWGLAFTFTHLPRNFIIDVTRNRQDLSELWLALLYPCFFSIITIPIAGVFIDLWQSVSQFNSTQIHKIVIGISYTVAALAFLIFTRFTHCFFSSVVHFVVIKSVLACSYVILEITTVNLAPRHSSLLSGLGQFFQSSSVAVAQTFIGMTVDVNKLEDWNVYFYSSAGVLILGALVFVLWSSSEPQTWSMSLSQTRRRQEAGHSRNDIELLELARHS